MKTIKDPVSKHTRDFLRILENNGPFDRDYDRTLEHEFADSVIRRLVFYVRRDGDLKAAVLRNARYMPQEIIAASQKED